MTSPRLWFALSALSALSAFFPLSAQSVRVTGRVLTADSTPVPGARVVLHRIAPNVQGPLDSIRADRGGRFGFAFRPDTAAFYLVSSRHSGIEYFSPPVSTNPGRPDTAVRIVVYDTSSNALVTVEARHLVITRAGENGTRGALDLIVLQNTGQRTRVTSDTLHPSISLPLPAGTSGLQVGESEVSAESVHRKGDSLMITAPIAPGEKQLTVQYHVPAGRSTLELPVQGTGQKINVLLEETGARVSGAGMAFADSQVIQGRSFRRWSGVTPAPGVIRISLPGTPYTAGWLLAALVFSMGAILLVAGWYFVGRRNQRIGIAPGSVLDAIAGLDARYVGRQEETPPSEWQSYLNQRARLKAELETSLAADRTSR